MTSKWLRFRLIEKGYKYKTSVWSVENKKNKDCLGLIKWFASWRQYCFMIDIDTTFCNKLAFAQSCLRDIAEFIKEQMDKRKKNV